MQTFLPYDLFDLSVQCLDRQRLGKQRVEVLQILKALLVPGAGWANHPAVKMWQGHESALCLYGMSVCREWIDRGYKDTCREKIWEIYIQLPANDLTAPQWLGDPAFHASHRAALLYKDPAHYGRFGWTEAPALNYVWPTPTEATP